MAMELYDSVSHHMLACLLSRSFTLTSKGIQDQDLFSFSFSDSLSLLVAVMDPKVLKTKISHTHSLIHSHTRSPALSLK